MSKLLDEAIEAVDVLDDDEFNSLIDYIRASIKNRAARRNAVANAKIQVGTRVKLSGPRKPQYLQGLTGEVVEKKQSRVVVKLDRGPVGKFRNGRVSTAPGGLTVVN